MLSTRNCITSLYSPGASAAEEAVRTVGGIKGPGRDTKNVEVGTPEPEAMKPKKWTVNILHFSTCI